jgi:uncharacterized protein
MRLARLAAISLLWGASLGAATALPAAENPAHTGLVVDQAGLLSPQLASQLESSLRAFQARVGPQIQLLTIPTLAGQPIESYSIQVVDRWKLGDAKRDDGVLFLVVSQDRQMRIEVGQGLEGVVPDAVAGRIVNDVVAPYFKRGQMEQGVVAGLRAIAGRLGGELGDFSDSASRPQAAGGGERVGIPLFPVLVFLLLILPILFRRRRSYGPFGSVRPRGGFLSGMILGGMLGRDSRRDDWFGGGGGGGGFGGGGGGGFSGGGASGRW